MTSIDLRQSDKIGPLEQMTPEKIRRAALAVCGLTGDVTAAREVLEALDLMGPLQKAVA